MPPTPTDPGSDADARSLQMLAEGGLPLRARERLAAMTADSAFTSDLSTAEFQAIRAVGFEPVGQVLGCSVYQIGFVGGAFCGVPSGRLGWGAAGSWAGFGYLVRALRDVRHRAMERARAEAAALGGDGVVAVRLVMERFPGAQNALEFRAVGTAVRAAGTRRPPRPFLSDLSGQEFAKLIDAGWVPVDIVMGIAVEIRHDDWQTRRTRSLFNTANAEIAGYTELVTRARAESRRALGADLARVGADAAVIAAIDLHMREQECLAYEGCVDHIAEATVLGTAIARFGSPRRQANRRLAVLPVSAPHRRGGRRSLNASPAADRSSGPK